jgi:hypothetical protein
MTNKSFLIHGLLAVAVAASLVVLSSPAFAQCPIPVEDFIPDPNFTSSFMLKHCEFKTKGANPYFILKPGYRIVLESEDELVHITVLNETKVVNGVKTRVVEEREWEKVDGGLELNEVSRNFYAICEQTNSVVYFGEEVVGAGGAWMAGVNGAKSGLIMPGTILLGSRYYQEIAPADSALDKGEIVEMDAQCTALGDVANEFGLKGCVTIVDTTDCGPSEDTKIYAKGVGLVQDEELQLVSYGFVHLGDDGDDDDDDD